MGDPLTIPHNTPINNALDKLLYGVLTLNPEPYITPFQDFSQGLGLRVDYFEDGTHTELSSWVAC